MNTSTVTCFKDMAPDSGVPYQTLINLCLDDCVKKGLRISFA